MISQIYSWILNNKLSAFLIVIVLFLAFKIFSPVQMIAGRNLSTDSSIMIEPSYDYNDMPAAGMRKVSPSAPRPINTTQDRMTITNPYFSLLVKNVTDSISEISSKVKSLDGYFVDTNISRPEAKEDATITMRVPTDKVEELQKFLRTSSVKVVSENISGQDITDQYTDIQSRIDTLEKMARRIRSILDEAVTVDEMLRAQNQLFDVQNQIDAYKGQLKYLEGASSTSLISVNLSTDELSLPYAPTKSWRPQVVFKEAVRSLLRTLQTFGSTIIWLNVYLVIIIPVGLVIYVARRLIKR